MKYSKCLWSGLTIMISILCIIIMANAMGSENLSLKFIIILLGSFACGVASVACFISFLADLFNKEAEK